MRRITVTNFSNLTDAAALLRVGAYLTKPDISLSGQSDTDNIVILYDGQKKGIDQYVVTQQRNKKTAVGRS